MSLTPRSSSPGRPSRRTSSSAANLTRLVRALGCDGYALAAPALDRRARPVLARRRRRSRARAGDAVGARPRRARAESSGRRGSRARRLNVATACLHRWAARTPDAVAAVFRGEDGARREWTFAELSARDDAACRGARRASASGRATASRSTCRCAPEVAVASHACAHIGAVQVPIFSGFAAPAIVATAAGLGREGRDHRRLVAPARRRGCRCARRSTRRGASRRRRARRLEWARVRPDVAVSSSGPGELPPLEVDAEHPYLLAYTSGTTGRPKGVLHVHGRLPDLDRARGAYQSRRPRRRPRPLRDRHGLDHGAVDRGRRGRARRGGVYMEGAPDWPDDRLWRLDRGGARDDARRLADADPGADPEGRAGDRPLVPTRDHDDRRAVEPGPYDWLHEHVAAAVASRS